MSVVYLILHHLLIINPNRSLQKVQPQLFILFDFNCKPIPSQLLNFEHKLENTANLSKRIANFVLDCGEDVEKICCFYFGVAHDFGEDVKEEGLVPEDGVDRDAVHLFKAVPVYG